MLLLSPSACEAQQEEKEVGEIEIQRQRANDRIRRRLPIGRRQRHILQALRIVGDKSREDDHASKRENHLKCVAVPEDADDGCEHYTQQSHEEKLTEPSQTAFGDGSVLCQPAE